MQQVDCNQIFFHHNHTVGFVRAFLSSWAVGSSARRKQPLYPLIHSKLNGPLARLMDGWIVTILSFDRLARPTAYLR